MPTVVNGNNKTKLDAFSYVQPSNSCVNRSIFAQTNTCFLHLLSAFAFGSKCRTVRISCSQTSSSNEYCILQRTIFQACAAQQLPDRLPNFQHADWLNTDEQSPVDVVSVSATAADWIESKLMELLRRDVDGVLRGPPHDPQIKSVKPPIHNGLLQWKQRHHFSATYVQRICTLWA
jgi:hypothetical protein